MSQKTKVNKFLAGAVTATMVATAVVPTAALAADRPSDAYSDLGALNDETVKELDRVLDLGLMTGFQNAGVFKPAINMNRAQVAKALAKYEAGKSGMTIAQYFNAHKLDGKVEPFSDVPKTIQDTELYQASLIVKDTGVFKGVNNKLNYAQNITRGHMATVLVRAFNLKATGEATDFADKGDAPTTEIANAMQILKDNGVAKELSDNKFHPNNNVKRIQMASFLLRAYEVENGSTETPGVADGITAVKAINDTRVEVTFKDAINKDFIREAELNGKYFVIYKEGNTVESGIQSKRITFSPDGKSAEFDLEDEIESGKKYTVVLMDGDKPAVAEKVHSYGPTVLKAAASTPGFDVSAVSDKIYVKFNTKMKDGAKEASQYTVYDEGGRELGPLTDFVEVEQGKWSNLIDKKEVEFKLSPSSDKKQLSAGKKYKLVVSKDVQTDDNKTLAENKRTITVKTPSVDEASPVAKVARITGTDEITIYFDKDIAGKDIKVNPAQLDLRTSTNKTVTVEDIAVVEELKGDTNALVLKLTLGKDANDEEVKLDEGTTYRVDMPANIVKNGVFPNAMNKATSGLKAEAQANDPISSMKAQIVANDKKNDQADLILTFDQVPVLDDIKDAVRFFDGRKEYTITDGSEIKVYGGDTSGKSVIIENIEQFERVNAGDSEDNGKKLVVRGDKSYDVEIDKGELTTASFVDENKATNKKDLKASTKGISVAAPKFDEMRLESAEKIVVEFKEEIKGNVSPSDISVKAFVANRSDIFDGSEADLVSGSGYYDVKVSGKTMTITAKTGVKFVTGVEGHEEIVVIPEDVLTNSGGKVGNDEIVLGSKQKDDIVDNAAPVIVGVKIAEATGSEKDKDIEQVVTVTYSEAVEYEGSDNNIATLFFADKGENAVEATSYSSNTAEITFNKLVAKESTDLTKLTLKYTAGNTFYIQDEANNKMKTQTVTGFVKEKSNGNDKPTPSEVDKTALNKAIKDAEKADKEGKTPESVKALEEAIANAQKVAADKDATKAEVDKAIKAVEDAVKNLKDKEDVGEEKVYKVGDIEGYRVTQDDLTQSTLVALVVAKLPEELKGKTLTINGVEFKEDAFNIGDDDDELIAALPTQMTEAQVKELVITTK